MSTYAHAERMRPSLSGAILLALLSGCLASPQQVPSTEDDGPRVPHSVLTGSAPARVMYRLSSDLEEAQHGGTPGGATNTTPTDAPPTSSSTDVRIRNGARDEIAFEIQRRDPTVDHLVVRFDVPAFLDVTRGETTYAGPLDDQVLTLSLGVQAREAGRGNVTVWFEIPGEDAWKLGPSLVYVVER